MFICSWLQLTTTGCFCYLCSCRGFVHLDVATFQWGLPEGTDPDPFLTFLVIIKAACLFLDKHTVQDKDKWVIASPTTLSLLRTLDHEAHGSERWPQLVTASTWIKQHQVVFCVCKLEPLFCIPGKLIPTGIASVFVREKWRVCKHKQVKVHSEHPSHVLWTAVTSYDWFHVAIAWHLKLTTKIPLLVPDCFWG